MKSKLCLFILLWFGCLHSLLAQTQTISGTVKDENNQPLPGVSVVVKGSNNGTTTDVEGKFKLNAAGNSTLIVSFIGYTTEEVPVNGRTSIDIPLVPNINSLQEVVVTALGIQRQAKSLTYAAQKIEGAQMVEVRDGTGNAVNALAGKVAGLTLTQAATGPGGAVRMTLRGNRSISNNNNALIVVDGVAIDNGENNYNPGSILGQNTSTFGGNNPSGSGASNINPDDIDNITVLKGAAAAALYGSRAANGVVLITTKKGKSGKVSVDLNSGISMASPMLLPKYQNQYGQGSAGSFDPNSSFSWGPQMQGQTVTDWTGKQTALTAQPNNVSDFFRNALTVNNAVGITGGSEKIQSYISYANNYIQGIVPANDMMRHTFNLRLSTQLTSRLNVDGKITYMNQNIDGKPNLGQNGGAPLNSLFQTPRNISLSDMRNYQSTDPYTGLPTQNYWLPGSSLLQNPYWSVYNNFVTENRNRITAFGLAKYDLTNWLTAQVRFSLDRFQDRSDEKDYAGTYWLPNPNGSYTLGSNYVSERNIDFLLSGHNDISSDLKINYNVGAQLLNRNGEQQQYQTADGLIVPNLFTITNTQNVGAQYYYYNRNLQGIYGTAQLSFRDYLILDLTARNDWSSTLPAANRSYFYPSVGLTSIISEMTTLPDWVSFAKVRASFTQVGNDAPPYLVYQNYSVVQGGGGGWAQRNPTQLLPTLKPEITKSWEVGTEWKFFENRLGLDLTVYQTNTINQLVIRPLPAASGYQSQYTNVGNVRNQGVEATLNIVPIKKENFSWNSSFNFAAFAGKVLSLSQGADNFVMTPPNDSRLGAVEAVVGARYGEIYGTAWATDPATGKYLINDNGLPVATANPVRLGNFNPNWQLGWNNTFNYKNWTLGVLVDGRFGGIVVSGGNALRAYDGLSSYTTAFRNGGWVLPGINQETGQPNNKAINAETFWKAVGGQNPYITQMFAYDATNVRLRELNLGYNFKISNTKFLKSARISFVARNLFFFYRGSSLLNVPGIGKRKMDFDPEATIGSGNVQGIEYNSLPSTRTVGLNVKLGF